MDKKKVDFALFNQILQLHIKLIRPWYTMFISAVFEIKDSFDFRSENPLPNDLQRTLLEARQYNFVHDVIEEIAFV